MNNLSRSPCARILNNNHYYCPYILMKKRNMGSKIDETV
jgi:hypothetical protein